MSTNIPPVPKHADRMDRAKTRPYAFHRHNPTGSKLMRRAYRLHFSTRATYEVARDWYVKDSHHGAA